MSNQPHLFEIEGAQFVVGLFWQPLSSASASERKKEIKTLAKELGFDLAVLRQGDTQSVGFTDSKQLGKSKKGIYSAAAIVSKSLEMEFEAKDFIFITKLPDGQWFYVAQRQSSILPDGDVLFASEDAARAQCMEHMSLGEWGLVVAPELWGIQGAVERNFGELLPKDKKGKLKRHAWWALAPVGGGLGAQLSVHSGKIIIGVASISAVVVGSMLYNNWQAKKAAEEAMLAAMLDESGQLIPPERPWKNAPLAQDFFSSCRNAVSSQNLFPGNWALSEVNCVAGSLSIAWHPKQGGWIKHLRQIVPGATISMDGTSASLQASLPAMPAGGDEAVLSSNERLAQMYSAAQVYGVVFSAEGREMPEPLPGEKRLPPDWKEINWRTDGVDFPQAVIAALDGPGFRITSMTAKFTNGKFVWTMEGIQYVQP